MQCLDLAPSCIQFSIAFTAQKHHPNKDITFLPFNHFLLLHQALRFGESAIGDVDMFYQDSGTHDGRGGSDEATPSQGLEDGGVLHSPRSNDSLQGVVQSMTSPRSASVAVDEAVRDISVQGKSYSLRAIGGVCNITRALVKDTVKEGKKVLQKAGFSLSSSDESILSGVVSAEATSSTTTSTGSGSGHVGFFKGSSMSPLSPPGRSKLMLMSPSSVASDLKAASSSSDSLGQSLSQKKQPIMKTEQDWGQVSLCFVSRDELLLNTGGTLFHVEWCIR